MPVVNVGFLHASIVLFLIITKPAKYQALAKGFRLTKEAEIPLIP